MRLLVSLITKGGIPAFFFFSYVLMLLWNSLIADHFGWAPPLSYLQTAGLWFLVILSLAWAAIGSRSLVSHRRQSRRSGSDDRFERDVEWQACGSDMDGEKEDVGARVERKIKRGLARWVGTDGETDWEDLGALIERKIRRCVHKWVD